MRHKISRGPIRLRRALAWMTAIMAATARPGSPQDSTTSTEGPGQSTASENVVCWRGAPRPSCLGFFLVEMQGVMPLAQSEQGQPDASLRTFESRLEWNLGYMANVSQKWAIGGSVTVGTGASDVLAGVRGRVRRWLGPEHSVELEVGVVRLQRPFRLGDLSGLTAGLRYNVQDRGSLFVRWDAVDAPPFSFPRGSWGGPPDDPGGFRQAIHVGVGTGSSWALVTTGALGVGYLVLLGLLFNSGFS